MKLFEIRIYFPKSHDSHGAILGCFFSFQESAQNKGNFLLTSVRCFFFFLRFYQESQWTVGLRGDGIKV